MRKPLVVKRDPCSTCPYRKDTPSGLWHEDEYEKLRAYDEGAPEPAIRAFLCHHTNITGNDTACKGWLMVHRDHVSVRLSISLGFVDPKTAFAEPACQLYASGNEAADAGERDIKRPGRKAREVIAKFTRTGRFTDGADRGEVPRKSKRRKTGAKAVHPKKRR